MTPSPFPEASASVFATSGLRKNWSPEHANHEVWVSAGRRFTGDEAARALDEIAGGVLCLGLRSGDRAAVYGRSRWECFALFIALSSIGVTYVGLDPRYTERELRIALQDARPRAVFAFGESCQSVLSASEDAVPDAVRVVSDAAEEHHHFTWTEVLQLGRTAPNAVLVDGVKTVHDGLAAAIIYTSGSTGRPKGAVLSQKAVSAGARLAMENVWPVRPTTVTMLPINHVAWLIETCLAVFHAGGTLIFQERFSPDGVVQAMRHEGVDSLFLVPTMVHKLLDDREFAAGEAGRLKRVFFGSAMDPHQLERLTRATGADLVTGLGMTETSGGYTFTDLRDSVEAIASSVGRVHPEVSVRLVDDSRTDVPTGTTGEILVRGPGLFDGYLNGSQPAPSATDEDGFFATGDLAVADAGGLLRVVGRAKDVFKSGGFNVYPAEVEAYLESNPEVSQAVVIAVPDPQWGEVGVAFVVLEQDESGDARSAILEMARTGLANYKVPKRVHVRADLPALPNGKVNRNDLRAEALRDLRADPSQHVRPPRSSGVGDA